MLNLGMGIRVLRKHKKITQRELATLAEVSALHLCYVENNRRDPSIKLLRRIAFSLGISLEALLLEALCQETEA